MHVPFLFNYWSLDCAFVQCNKQSLTLWTVLAHSESGLEDLGGRVVFCFKFSLCKGIKTVDTLGER